MWYMYLNKDPKIVPRFPEWLRQLSKSPIQDKSVPLPVRDLFPDRVSDFINSQFDFSRWDVSLYCLIILRLILDSFEFFTSFFSHHWSLSSMRIIHFRYVHWASSRLDRHSSTRMLIDLLQRRSTPIVSSLPGKKPEKRVEKEKKYTLRNSLAPIR